MVSAEAEKRVQAILTESILSLDEARKEVGQITGRRPDKSTVFRWIHKGARGSKLEAIRLGNRIYTSREALTRFFQNQTSATIEG